ncbi:olfactory receptor 14A16-like [Tiliqua scincoides]|uniref:olfactory receptor 14A16-like n=1 Tax=Tiliqua scincoides TaxID=71010 RepID=UPI00346382C2
MTNQSRVMEFLLHGFSDIQELQPLLFIAFLVIYLVALMENLLIITIIIYSHSLHKPMYFFLANLACQDLGSISVTVPRSMSNSLLNTQAISFSGCVCQVFFLVFFLASHFILLGVMAFDRYMAICNPLHYETLMTRKTCIQMASGVWISGLIYAILYTGNTFTIEFCSNDIDQFFCEIPHVLKLACSDSSLAEVWILCFGVSTSLVYFAVIIYSYVQIFRAVLNITSSQGKQKAFSTCLPHLIVIFLYVICASFTYLSPIFNSESTMNLLISIFYCVVPPVMNPLIYTMRNKELKTAFWKLLVSFQYLHKDHWPACVF